MAVCRQEDVAKNMLHPLRNRGSRLENVFVRRLPFPFDRNPGQSQRTDPR